MNALSINIPANFIASCESTLKRYNAAKTDAERRAVLDRQTVQGLWWAIGFVSKISAACMSEKELQHAIRLTRFRGTTSEAARWNHVGKCTSIRTDARAATSRKASWFTAAKQRKRLPHIVRPTASSRSRVLLHQRRTKP